MIYQLITNTMTTMAQAELIAELKTFATTLAKEAGQVLAQAYQAQDVANAQKRTSPKDMKLAEDKTMDQWLVSHIQRQYPDHAIVIEESGRHNLAVGESGESASDLESAQTLWIIDPIDGSANFAAHNPFVAISIAVMIRGELVIGVIEAPLLGEQFVAVRGQGATMNGRMIRVSETAQLSDAYLVSCDGGHTDRVEVFSTLIRNYYDQVKDFRKLGSAALECAWVACGRADAYLTMSIDAWDVAAGVLLVQEAGGKVTTFKGGTWRPERVDLICSNTILHNQITERMWE